MAEQKDTPTPPPFAVMARLLDGFQVSQALFAIADLGVPTILDQEGPTPLAVLAERTAANPDALRRLVRSLAPLGVFTTDGDQVSITPLGATLSENHPHSLLGVARAGMQFHYLPFTELRHTLRTGQPAADKYYGMPYFDWLAADPARSRLFSQAMATFATTLRAGIFDGYRLPRGKTIADIGGSDGTMLARLLDHDDDPARRGIVLDLPATIQAARTSPTATELADRLEFVAGDFFTAVPTADIYLLGWILHDWSDQDALRVLGSISAAANPGARVIILEGIVPPGDQPHPTKALDLAMLGILGGKERTEQEYRDLLESAGFTLDRVLDTPSPYAILEATLR
ncbi:methyltransferase [Umezawaea endophytica]|uniref:Acetylserotonin O-methyltransferase n=1 Tax=Umezawaea endophytica TaxID=1654476 RepID=A0A9X3A449_9PSEU|nr:acetylserotonin O-methyltransferase [Umezawaea endophytica]MCS7482489.1 acetylserotonin O-methyltransferase [Umezawaea endophytica]